MPGDLLRANILQMSFLLRMHQTILIKISYDLVKYMELRQTICINIFFYEKEQNEFTSQMMHRLTAIFQNGLNIQKSFQ